MRFGEKRVRGSVKETKRGINKLGKWGVGGKTRRMRAQTGSGKERCFCKREREGETRGREGGWKKKRAKKHGLADGERARERESE